MGSGLVTLVRNLQQRKARRRRGLALAEGVRLVEDALAAGVAIRGALAAASLATTPRGEALIRALAEHAVRVEELPDRALADLADTETPQGIIAVIEAPGADPAMILPRPGRPVLVLDGVQDPGNVGALLRTGFALGAAGALLLTGTADLTNPKVVRAAMGASFRLPAGRLDHDGFAHWAAKHDVTIWVAAPDGTSLGRAKPPARLAIVVGSEAGGTSPAVQRLSRQRVGIPLVQGAESLNVAVAAGIILYEVQRGS